MQYDIEYGINDMGLFASRNCYARAPSTYSKSKTLRNSAHTTQLREVNRRISYSV